MTRRGAFIVFEGIDNSGKTTQVDLLVASLRAAGEDVLSVKFPDPSTPTGVVLEQYLNRNLALSPEVAHLLFSANRWESFSRMKELLERGTTLVADRYVFSGAAYTAALSGRSLFWCKQADSGLPRPDLVFRLFIPPHLSLLRQTGPASRLETYETQAAVSRFYDALSLDEAVRWVTLDGSRPVSDVHDEVLSFVKTTIPATVPLGYLW